MVELSICVGSACHLKGSYKVIEQLKFLVDKSSFKSDILIKANFCLGNCTNAVSVKFNEVIYSVAPDTVGDFFENIVEKYFKEIK